MPLFGISKNEAQRMIDEAITLEATARASVDNDLYQQIGNEATARRDTIETEATTRYAHDQALLARITALETGTPPTGPPAPTALLTIKSEGASSLTEWTVILEAAYTPTDATVAIVCSNQAAQQGANNTRWFIPRTDTDTDVQFLMTVTLPDARHASSTTSTIVPAREHTEPPPEPTVYELQIPASSFTIDHALTLHYSFDHFADWGHPGESVSVNVHVDEAAKALLWFDYVLARESDDATDRVIGPNTASFDATCDKWAQPLREWSDEPVALDLAAGDTNIAVVVPEDSPAWSNWLDLYAARIRADKPITLTVMQGRAAPLTPAPMMADRPRGPVG